MKTETREETIVRLRLELDMVKRSSVDSMENIIKAFKDEADQRVADANQRADKAVEDANQRAQEAARRAQKAVADTNHRAQKAVEDANQRADKAVEDANQRARRAEENAESRAQRAEENAEKRADKAYTRAEKAVADAEKRADKAHDRLCAFSGYALKIMSDLKRDATPAITQANELLAQRDHRKIFGCCGRLVLRDNDATFDFVEGSAGHIVRQIETAIEPYTRRAVRGGQAVTLFKPIAHPRELTKRSLDQVAVFWENNKANYEQVRKRRRRVMYA
ncbi:hypothetical protein PR003_g6406 [Phytophthora rubi]|uniref:Uncharacterized protein n=1 Tax=Phytophthora rubi TaxID=129364 RepID=A0A6A3MZS9_9STRA|nr:hypothetical protein PR002_g6650 [Phytophthora rubi]KAE9051466.1 hypothetical protein PR001_g1418 [Phytophthora rubi]KAE9348484.1 hypothetical protein PR003_g6406 [Phytophthora rubi]